MASIKFNIISRKNPSNLNIRFYHGKNIDCNAKSNILIDPKIWSNKMQNLKSLTDNESKKFYRTKINALKLEIIKKFTEDYSNGKLINSKWLNILIEDFYKRPTDENDYKIFLIPFITKYIDESENRINLKTGKKISFRTIQKYKTTLNQIKDFEEKEKDKYHIKNIDLDFHKRFTTHLKLDKNYSNTMIEKIISQLKSFIRNAKEKGYETSPEVESRNFTFRRDETIDIFLDEKEIEIIYNLDFSNNTRLNNVRDLFIIGLWTGLRVSDLKRINQFHFSKDRIIISSTEKTNSSVKIPIHPQVKNILTRRNKKLPRIISDQKFNLYIKEICKIAGFTERVLGYKKNSETNRKEKGYFPKYELVSSHICRRSFTTNHYGKIDDKALMAITSHRSHSQFIKYVKTTQKQHVKKVEKYWAEQNEINNSLPKLNISY
ncbi:tyrosine-type recombinase/integrase [Polaribacter porphyrae]|uniref:Uncharacterized protein n=1 Tax=Polaribacter porphyrae TaxID=1137780 RepID=A0A2S7WQG5_9FLAO|nr:phage integrase SAM-like domain-containing protein [Polaribacter porphyrae]PQJ79552.1 hypothetical protein BTO18_10375 [Polaribacter porphyrae]